MGRLDDPARSTRVSDVGGVVLAGAGRRVSEADRAAEEIPGERIGEGGGNAALDTRGSRASVSRGGLDGEFDDRAVQDGVAVVGQGGAGIAETRESEESGIRDSPGIAWDLGVRRGSDTLVS